MLKRGYLFLLLIISINSYSAIQHFESSAERGDCKDDDCVLKKIDDDIQKKLYAAKAIKLDSVTYTFFKKYSTTSGEWKYGSDDGLFVSWDNQWKAHNYVNTEWKDDSIMKIMSAVWYET